MARHIPNILSLLRLILIAPIVIYIAEERYILALIFLILSGITDVLDGTIARKFNFITDVGKLLDPFADKATQVAILVTLALKGVIPFWILSIVVIKEFAMIAGASFLYGKELVVSSKWYGKLATVIFYIAIACSLVIRYLNNNVFDSPIYDFSIYVYCVALVATIFALIMYFRAFNMKTYIKDEKEKLK